jgi:hypothetical protein
MRKPRTSYPAIQPQVKAMTKDEQAPETIPADELARLRRIEEAAKRLLDVMPGRRSATEMLSALAELRAAVNAKPS